MLDLRPPNLRLNLGLVVISQRTQQMIHLKMFDEPLEAEGSYLKMNRINRNRNRRRHHAELHNLEDLSYLNQRNPSTTKYTGFSVYPRVAI